MLDIQRFVLGPVTTNTYLIADTITGKAAVIDPAGQGNHVLEAAREKGWRIQSVWLTHAHFDHIAGVRGIMEALEEGLAEQLEIGLHPDDLPLWNRKGGAEYFGLHMEPGPAPNFTFQHGQELELGEQRLEVRHAPGHTRGHVMFYSPETGVLFCGDVIFKNGIGRTDLPGGDFETLMKSIQEQVLTLPEETILLSGHGPESTVGAEKRGNLYIR
jgi:glyoxylase-like metal-dependent hydrolase (beta-lactamase superfamily II)